MTRTQVRHDGHVAGVDGQGGAEQALCVGKVSLLKRNDAEQLRRIEIVRRIGQHLAVERSGFREPTLALQIHGVREHGMVLLFRGQLGRRLAQRASLIG